MAHRTERCRLCRLLLQDQIIMPPGIMVCPGGCDGNRGTDAGATTVAGMADAISTVMARNTEPTISISTSSR